MRKIIDVLLVLAALAALAYPGAHLLDAAYGVDAFSLATVNDAETVEFNQALFDDDGLEGMDRVVAVLEIYGSNPQSELSTDRYILFDDANLIVPEEDPSLSFLPAGSAGGAYTPQAVTFFYMGGWITGGGLLALVALLVMRRFVVGKRDDGVLAA